MSHDADAPSQEQPAAAQSRPTTRIVILLLLAVAIPPAAYFAKPLLRSLKPLPKLHEGTSAFPQSIRPFARKRIGPQAAHNAQICNVQVVDFDRDGLSDIIVCDALRSQVILYRQSPKGTWTERVLGDDLLVPAHATVVDLD